MSVITDYPAPPYVRASYPQRMRIVREFHTGSELAREVGPVARIGVGPAWLGVPQVVFVTSPRGMHDVLAGFDGTFDKETIVHAETRVWGHNLFNMTHARWQPRKRALQPVFTKRNVSTYAADVDAVAEAPARRWQDSRDVNLETATRALTLDVIGRSVLGLDLAARAAQLGPMVHEFIRYPADRGMQPLRLPRSWSARTLRRYRAAEGELRAVCAEAIDRARRDPDHPAPLVRQLMATTDPETGRGLSDREITDELMAFLVAGHDTTATALAYALWQLARHEDIQQKVADEVLALGERDLTPEDVRSLPYTGQVLCEAMRLAPPGAVVGRLTMREAVVDGYRVAAGTNLILSIYALHRDPALWPDPLRFDPERFGPAAMKAMDRWQYLPFGAGPRSCIGDHFAMLEAVLVVATLVRRLRLTSAQLEFPMAVPFTLVAGGPVRVQVTPRR